MYIRESFNKIVSLIPNHRDPYLFCSFYNKNGSGFLAYLHGVSIFEVHVMKTKKSKKYIAAFKSYNFIDCVNFYNSIDLESKKYYKKRLIDYALNNPIISKSSLINGKLINHGFDPDNQKLQISKHYYKIVENTYKKPLYENEKIKNNQEQTNKLSWLVIQ